MTNWPHKDFAEEVELVLGHRQKIRHLFEEKTVWAIKAAQGALRPLLLRGEPGVGKSQLAAAVAQVLKLPLITHVVTSRTESQDLHWTFDAVARLGQAQILSVTSGAAADLTKLDELKFLQPGPLWWAFDWQGAKDQVARTHMKSAGRASPDASWDWAPRKGTVLLIDEIDKADPDVPNGLLESLGNGEFSVPYGDLTVRCPAEHTPPLVLITTHEERELPAAFLRRCLVLQLDLPKGDELVRFLVARGIAHFGDRITQPVYEAAAEQLVRDRENQRAQALVKPGQAEYLDLLRALPRIAGESADKQLQALSKIQGFALEKNPVDRR
jgi:MoxR-like ATPase